MGRAATNALTTVLAWVLASLAAFAVGGQAEVTLSTDAWAKLETFEAHSLGKADQTFGRKVYRQALTEYDAFILEFPKSKAVPYAVYRKARCLHLDEKRFKAIEGYEGVLDYFPNVIEFAAPALYSIGECHQQNGDLEKAMKAWLEMATDKDYRKHLLAAPAIYHLADNLMKQDKAAEAVKYFEQVAEDFRNSNPDPARAAMSRAIAYYVRQQPSEPMLRELYRRTRSFEHDPRTIPKDAEIGLDKLYWQRVWERVWNEARAFNETQKDDRKRYFRYWAKAFDGKFAEWEEFQLHAANMALEASGDTDRWTKRMDEIFAEGFKTGDLGRIFRWIGLFKGHPKKVEEYIAKVDLKTLKLAEMKALMEAVVGAGELGLAKLAFNRIYETFDFATMSNREIETLAFVIFESLADAGMGQNMVRKIRVYQMPDPEKAALAKRLSRVDAPGVKWICVQFDDKDRGKNELLEFYYSIGKKLPKTLNEAEVKKERMELASHLVGVDAYAAGAWWKKAEFHFWDKQYQEAMSGYRMADNPPENLWQIVECFKGLGNVDGAIGQLVEIENFFKDAAPRAALTKAYVYRWARRPKNEIGAFRDVLKKYPKSGESSQAHQELEKLGVKTGGTVDAE
jgi:tetratricopeptide (TPR) repeat protein